MKLEIKRRQSRIELVPMIDVMFFMVVFFMVFSTLKTAQTGVPLELPKALHIGKAEQNTVVVSIDKQSRLFYGKQTVDLGALKERIRREIAGDAETQVVIRPDAAVPYFQVVKVMDALASVGVKKPLLGVDRQQMPNANRPEGLE
ncbi:biopolymer transport protein ExbD [Hydrogenispora ethanolica]|uniref:Biopolymer transport protein ExbD n=1 Tax=Hydrogenispora ethanolica TaxID=1082276 RepID=A0A4R1S280_HYDET|nr:biopolymer transporter ExbD [Hydrogenispora ethanolica]TCL73276.1 biopolymer transport protein ExbD [Hydrogenispora ethanolica]